MKISQIFLFFKDTATTEIYTLSLHDALPIYQRSAELQTVLAANQAHIVPNVPEVIALDADPKSTRLNSSHTVISYAVFCLKKKNSSTCRIPPPLPMD